MKIAVMQPYLFPYIGYFQLINEVDIFVIFDDVNFIKRGWINRNNILMEGKPHLFSIPLKKASQNRLINEIELLDDETWKKEFLKTIFLAYKKAPYFEQGYKLIENIIEHKENNLSKYIENSLIQISNYLNMNTKFINSSEIQKDNSQKAHKKIVEIVKILQGNTYINPIGGTELYDKSFFKQNNIDLKFIKTDEIKYEQTGDSFVPNLSIIDVLMHNGFENTQKLLKKYELIEHR